jgi:large subunit ribosomal protein L15
MRPGFEGGQMPLHRRLPKRGFTNIFRQPYAIVNLKDFVDFNPEEKITPDLVVARGLVKKLGAGLKVLGDGELKSPVHVVAHFFSKSALEKIQKAGGKAEVIS